MGVIHWMISVSEKFKLLPETFYLSINLFDRYLEKKLLLKKQLQLIASSCLLIASKYEEIYPPEIRDFVYISNRLFNKEDMIEIEYDILKILNFNLLTVSPYIFLVRFHFISGDNNIKIFYLASYILDICLTDVNFCKNKSSLKACVVLYMSRKIILGSKKEIIIETAIYTSNYINNKYTKNYKRLPTYIKYSSKKYCCVADFFEEFFSEKKNVINDKTLKENLTQ